MLGRSPLRSLLCSLLILNANSARSASCWDFLFGRSRLSAEQTHALALLKNQGLHPRHKLKLRKLTIHYSDPFYADGHVFVSAIIHQGARENPVLFYRSNSHGLFKQLPSYFKRGPLMAGSWFDKGAAGSTLSLTPPPEFQEALLSKLPASLDDLPRYPFELLEGIVPFFSDIGDQRVMTLWNSADYPGGSGYRKRALLAPTRPSLKLIEGEPWRAPSEVLIEKATDAPNYRKSPRTYRFANEIYGDLKAEVFPSKNKRLEYTILTDARGRICIADIGARNEPLTPQGLRTSYVDADELVAPLWERLEQIPPPYQGGARDAHGYRSNWPYIRELPEVRRYYRERGIPMPP